MIPGIIFDMDGVIVDSEPLHHKAERKLLSRYGITISSEELHSFTGKNAFQLLNGFIKQYQLDISFESFYEEHKKNIEETFRTSHIPVTNAIVLIHALHENNIPLALASSSHRLLIQMVLERADLEKHFQVVVAGDEIEKSKPCPDIYIEAARRLGKAPALCIAIEDSKNGVHSAKDAGCYCIGYVNPNSGNQDLSRADEIIHDFDSLTVNHLLKLNSQFISLSSSE